MKERVLNPEQEAAVDARGLVFVSAGAGTGKTKVLVERFARWRNEPPTDKQRELLARNRIPAPEGLTRGQASQMISLMLASPRS